MRFLRRPRGPEPLAESDSPPIPLCSACQQRPATTYGDLVGDLTEYRSLRAVERTQSLLRRMHTGMSVRATDGTRTAAAFLTAKGYLAPASPRSSTTYVVLREPDRLCGKCFRHSTARMRDEFEAREAGKAARREATNAAREAAAAARAEKKAERAEALRIEELRRNPWLGASAYLGLEPPSERFECAECGRLETAVHADQVLRRVVIGREPAPLPELTDAEPVDELLMLVVWTAGFKPIRPAYLQEVWDITYEDAVRVLDTARRLGLLDEKGKAFVRAAPLCGYCYQRRDATLDEPERPPSLRDPIPAQLRFRVLQRDNFRCVYCGRSSREGVTLHLDHLVPVAAGGPTDEGNLVTACQDCNLGKSIGAVLPE
jgi:HNH endonuclease